MKEYKTFNQQLAILRKRGLIVPKDGRPKRFLEQENYYLKVLLDKKYFQKFHEELNKIFERYKNEFKTVDFTDILKIMGIDRLDLQRLL